MTSRHSADHLGSTTMVLDSAGNAVPNASQKYYPFGRQRSTTSVNTDKQFTGHQRGGELYFMHPSGSTDLHFPLPEGFDP